MGNSMQGFVKGYDDVGAKVRQQAMGLHQSARGDYYLNIVA